MRWYFCLNESGLVNLGESALVAAISCLENTDLEPHFIYSGPPSKFTHFLKSIGINVHFHQISFRDDIINAVVSPGFSVHSALGAYLRYDIPSIDTSDEVVIYTDVDVIFHSQPPIFEGIDIFAACPELTIFQGCPVEFSLILNSGVLLLNLKNFRSEVPGLIDFCRANNFYFHGDGGYYDQGALNKYFISRWKPLPQSMNWRPYFSNQCEPIITHFHGLKPHQIDNLSKGGSELSQVASTLYD